VSVFDDIRQLQHLATTLTYNQTLSPTTMWNPQQTIVQYLKHQLEIPMLVDGVQKMLQTLNEKMYKLSGGEPIKYTIPPDHIDNLASTERGRSWLEGVYTEPRDQALMRAMVRQGSWRLSRPNKDRGLTWNPVACQAFMDDVGEIVDLIITLVHIGAGPPVRGEEIIRDQIANGIQPRTIYLNFGRLMAVRRHSKNTNLKGVDPFNVCFMPQSLSDAICYYLAVIRPLERVVAQQLYEDSLMVQEYDLFLYVKHGKRLTSTEFSTILEKLTAIHIGVGLSLQPLRHLLIAFQRAYVEESRAQRGNSIGDLLSSHTTDTAVKHYAKEHGVLEGFTAGHLLDIQEWCGDYHDAIGLGERIGPLIPLRLRRKHARLLGLMSGPTGADEQSITGTAASILKELGDTVYRSILDDLKPYLSAAVREAVSEGVEYLVSDRISSLPPSQGMGVLGRSQGISPEAQPLPGPSGGRSSQPLPSSELPTAPPLMRQPTPGPSQVAPPLANVVPRRRLKRVLSEAFEPAAKRVSVSATASGSEDHTMDMQQDLTTWVDDDGGNNNGNNNGNGNNNSNSNSNGNGNNNDNDNDNDNNNNNDNDNDNDNDNSDNNRDGDSPDGVDNNLDEVYNNMDGVDMSKEFADFGLDFVVESTPHPDELPSSSHGLGLTTRDYAAHSNASVSTIHPKHHSVPLTPLLYQGPTPGNQEEANTIARLSAMSLNPRQPNGHAGPPATLIPTIPRLTSGPVTDEVILQALRTIRRDHQAKFKSTEQQLLVKSTISGTYTIGVLPTGGGKSMAYEIPSICVGQLTIAVFPFRVILAQAMENCTRRGLPVERWGSTDARFVSNMRLVLMMTETLLSPTMLG
jgi:hypothetical protein